MKDVSKTKQKKKDGKPNYCTGVHDAERPYESGLTLVGSRKRTIVKRMSFLDGHLCRYADTFGIIWLDKKFNCRLLIREKNLNKYKKETSNKIYVLVKSKKRK